MELEFFSLWKGLDLFFLYARRFFFAKKHKLIFTGQDLTTQLAVIILPLILFSKDLWRWMERFFSRKCFVVGYLLVFFVSDEKLDLTCYCYVSLCMLFLYICGKCLVDYYYYSWKNGAVY